MGESSHRSGLGELGYLGDSRQRRLDDEYIEVDGALGHQGRVDNGADRVGKHRHLGPEETLPFVGLHRPQIDDRLELDMVVLFEGKEVVEDFAHRDLWCFVDADLIAQTGDLDGVTECDYVPLGGRQGRVHVGDAVGGSLGESHDDGFGQVFRARQHAPA